MAPRKRRAPLPAPPPSPPRESSTEYDSDTEEEEGPPRIAVIQKPPENSQPQSAAAAAAATHSSSEEDESDADEHDSHMIPASRSPPTKSAAAGLPPKSGHDEEEDGESSESEPEVPEPVQKKVAATKKSKPVEEDNKKRPAPEPAPAGKAKKAKAEAGKPAPDATPAGKGKMAKSEAEKAAPVKTPSGKAKKPVGKLDDSGLEPLGNRTAWSKEDSMKILESVAAHVKSEGAMPKADVLLAALGHRLDRKDCSSTDLYEKVRNLKKRYEKQVSNGNVPKKEDELRVYKLSEAIWGEKATEAIAAAVSQNDSAVTESKKGQAKKEKMDGSSKGGEVANRKGDTQKGSKKKQTIEAKTDRDVKTKLSEDTATGSPSKSKKQGSDKDKLGKDKDSKSGKETATTVSQNGDAFMKRKKGKMDKEKMDIDLMPKESLTGSQNGGTRTEEEIHEEDTERGADVHATIRSFDELQNLYPNLADFVERIKANHPCGQTLRRAFGSIDDVKANALELKIKAQRILELKAVMREDAVWKVVVNSLIGMAS